MRALLAVLLVLIAAPLAGCEVETAVAFRPGCEVTLDAVSPNVSPVAGGDLATLSGLWIASEVGVRDTVVRVGGQDAEVVAIGREGCDLCAACSTEAVRCRECEEVCRGTTEWEDSSGVVHAAETCMESVTFVVPEASEPGTVEISVTSRHGEASNIWLTYEPADDEGLAP